MFFIDKTITEEREIIFVYNKKALPQKAPFHLRLTRNISISTLNPASITYNYCTPLKRYSMLNYKWVVRINPENKRKYSGH